VGQRSGSERLAGPAIGLVSSARKTSRARIDAQDRIWGAVGFEVQVALETLGWRVRFWAAQVRIAAQDQVCDGASEGRGAASLCLPGEGGGTATDSAAERRGWRGRFGWRRRIGMLRRRLGGWWRGLGCQATVSELVSGERFGHTPWRRAMHDDCESCNLAATRTK